MKIKALIKRHFIAFIGISGLTFAAVFSVIYGNPEPTPPNQLSLPASSPFNKSISGIGMIEANTRNISISPSTPGVISEIYVREGDVVEEGHPLFIQDTRTVKAEISVQEKALDVIQAKIRAAKIDTENKKDLLDRALKLRTGIEISDQAMKQRHFDYERAKSLYDSLESEYEQEKKKLDLKKVELEKLTTRSPIAGTVLKVYVRPGEWVGNDLTQSPPIVLGNISPLHVRVQIDENDVWRFSDTAPAHIFNRSNKDITYPIKFVRVEPLLVPKQQISGNSRELVDTRILEVIYSVDDKKPDLFVGQKVDVFIKASEGP